jgi:hypothetical protein
MDTGGSRPITPGTAAPGTAELQLGILRQLQPSKSLAFIRSPQGIAELQLGFRPRARIGAFDAPSQFVRRIASQS